jgi:hypothetical protein
MTNQNQEQFIKTEIYKDIGDYKNMSLLALSKKLPYWKRIYNEKNYNGHLTKIHHLRNYCRDCDKDEIFVITFLRTFDNHYKPFTDFNLSFWKYYRENFKKLYFEAKEYYTETSKANEEVRCFCGGHYTSAHRAKHFKTQKHLRCELIV